METNLNIEVALPRLIPMTSPCNEAAEFNSEDFAIDIQEWLSLVSIGSPRIDVDDKIDSFLCRYTPPDDTIKMATLAKITWRGFMSSSWIHKVFATALKETAVCSAWFVFNICSFSGDWPEKSRASTVLKNTNGENI